MRQNQDDLEETVRFLKELDVDFKMPDPVRPTGRGCSREIIPKNLPREFSGEMDCPNFSTDEYTFRFNQHYNNCWAGKMAITADGKVIPCIFARDQVVGDVLRQELKEIIDDGELYRFWRITKDHVATCHICEYRYACHDCRPLAYGHRKNLFAKPPRCFYDPMRGKWNRRKFNFSVKKLKQYVFQDV
jgi:radical SAM protein with 4Fe4S-binding SPASM domain